MADKQTILIVDDEMDMRIFMSTLFETSGYHPVVARDGQQGLDQARKVRPDLIIMDVMMPGEGGALMYKNLKSDLDLCHIPVIMLSAVNEAAFRYYLKMLNTQLAEVLPDPEAYVEKPPDPDLLLRLTRQILPQQPAPA
jgi:two-component system phosphate regulon response regulator PhoB